LVLFLIFLGGLAIFVATLFYGREVMRYKYSVRRQGELLGRAAAAGHLPPAEAQAEFEAIRREFRSLLNGDKPRKAVHELSPSSASKRRTPSDTQGEGETATVSRADLLESVKHLEMEIDANDAIADHRRLREELSRLKQQISLLDTTR
jgi:hypothetical protein